MTSAIGDHTERDAGRTELPPAASGAEIVITHEKNSAQSPAGNAENQIGWPQLAESPGPLAAAGTLRVLIVEDDLAIGPLVAEVLEDLGHFVCAIETDAGSLQTRVKPPRHPTEGAFAN